MVFAIYCFPEPPPMTLLSQTESMRDGRPTGDRDVAKRIYL
jgi:hypothetical protein